MHTKAYIQICQTLLTVRCENTDWYQWMSISTECSICPWNRILCGHDKGWSIDTLQPQLRKQVKLKKTAWKTTYSRIPITHTAQNRETQRTNELLPRLGNTHEWRTTTSRQKAWGFVGFFFFLGGGFDRDFVCVCVGGFPPSTTPPPFSFLKIRSYYGALAGSWISPVVHAGLCLHGLGLKICHHMQPSFVFKLWAFWTQHFFL